MIRMYTNDGVWYLRDVLPMILGLSVLSATVSAPAQTTGPEEGTLRINLTDTSGLKVSSGSLSIKSGEGKVVYSATADGPVVQLPYGRYSVEFENPWSPRVSRDVVIDKPESFIELASTFVPEGGNTPVSISIKVDPAGSCTGEGSLWAKLVGVYSLDEMERRVVVPGGYALFEPVAAGSYVLIVVDGSKVRATLPIETTRPLVTAAVRLSACDSK
jgi:hypothetical protein